MSANRGSDQEKRSSPYVGLISFAEEDAPYFFGRDDEIRIVISNLRASRLTLLYGESGVGKSSLLNAGAVRRLRQLAERNREAYADPELAVVVFRQWEADPLTGLKRETHNEALKVAGADANHSAQGYLIEVLGSAASAVGGRLFVVLDQFEEFLRNVHRDKQAEFVGELGRVLRASDLRVNVLISIREDALARLDRLRSQIPSLYENMLRVQPLDRRSAEAAIVEPVHVFAKQTGERIDIDPDLAPAVLDEIGFGDTLPSEVANVSSIAPLLQLVMEALWDEEWRPDDTELRLATFETDRIGGAKGIVRRHVDKRFRSLPMTERQIAAVLFDYLVTPTGEKMAHSVESLTEWVQKSLPHASSQMIEVILEKLSCESNRILFPSPGPGDRYEISHDILGPPIRSWLARFREARRVEEERAKLTAKAAEQRHRDRQRVRFRTWIASLAVLAAAIAGALLVFGWIQYREASEQRAVAMIERERANRALTEATEHRELAEHRSRVVRAGQLAMHAQLELDGPCVDPHRSALLAIESLRIAPNLAGNLAIRHAARLLAPEVFQVHHDEPVCDVAFSPDGRYIVTASWDDSARVWDASTGEEAARLLHERDVRAICFSTDGQRVATASYDGTAGVWDSATGARIVHLVHPGKVTAVSLNPDGSQIATAGDDNVARVWDTATGTQVFRLDHDDRVSAIAFAPSGEWLASASHDHTARIWDSESGVEAARVEFGGVANSICFSQDGLLVAVASEDNTARVLDTATGEELVRADHDSQVHVVGFDPSAARIATACRDGTVRVWALATGAEMLRLTHEGSIEFASFSPNGEVIATGGSDDTVRLWDAATGEELGRLAHRDNVYAAAFGPDGTRIATASADGTARIWDVAPGAEPIRFAQTDGVLSVSFSPDGQSIASAGQDNSARIWSLDSNEQATGIHHDNHVCAVRFSPNGQLVATAGFDGVVKLCDVSTGEQTARFAHDREVYDVAFSPDGTRIASASSDRTVRIWDIEKGAATFSLAHDRRVYAVSFAPSGTRLAAGCGEGTVQLWDLCNQSEVRSFKHDATVCAIGFSSDGSQIATASWDRTARVWDIASGDEIARFVHDEFVYDIAFSPDGAHISTAGLDNAARVWDVVTEEEVVRLPHRCGVYAVAFSPCGSLLATGGADGRTRVWSLDTFNLLDKTCARASRNLTETEWNRYFPGEPYRCTCPDLPPAIDPTLAPESQPLHDSGRPAI